MFLFFFWSGAEVSLKRFWKTVGIMEQPDGEISLPFRNLRDILDPLTPLPLLSTCG